MPQPAKGLYTPRLVDFTFALMGLGSAVLLYNSGALLAPHAISASNSGWIGLALLGSVLSIGLSACVFHRIDQRGWDDYMGQVVTQSALIGMITILLTGVVYDFLIAPWLGTAAPAMMVQGMVPIACLAWAMGYGFLRWKGTSA